MPYETEPTNVYRESFQDTVKVAMDEAIAMISPSDVPLTTSLSSEGISNIKQEWLNDTLAAHYVTASAGSLTASPTITISADDATNVRPGDILMPRGTELLALVTAVNYTSGELTVTRPYAGSTDGDINPGDVMDLVGQAMVEGADPQDPRGNGPTSDYNYTQIFQEQIAATRTSRKNERYGISDPYAYDLMKRMKELAIKREFATLHSRRHDDPAAARRSMGGLFYYLTQNGTSIDLEAGTVDGTAVDTGADALEEGINEALRKCYEEGGSPSQLIVSPALKRRFSKINWDKVDEERGDTGVGRVKTSYQSDFGSVTVTVNRWMPRGKALVLDPAYVSQMVYDGWFHEPLAKTGDTDKGHVVGEFSLKVKAPKAHATLAVTGL